MWVSAGHLIKMCTGSVKMHFTLYWETYKWTKIKNKKHTRLAKVRGSILAIGVKQKMRQGQTCFGRSHASLYTIPMRINKHAATCTEKLTL